MIRGDKEKDAGDKAFEDKRYKFVIDLAPLDLVPHAIHLFLEQVDHGLMENTHFYLNGPHIVQAGPQPDWNKWYDEEQFYAEDKDVTKNEKISGNAISTIEKYEKQIAANRVPVYDDDTLESAYTEVDYYEEDKRTKKYQDLGLAELAFPDYNSKYPHVSWTVGYTGRPGGPDWYINKVDNTEGHGPGGQLQHDLSEQGDSCFGTISSEGEGRDMLAANIYSLGIYEDNSEWHHFIARPVRIVYAEVLTKEPILDHHLQLDHLTSQHRVFGSKEKRGEGTAQRKTAAPGNDQHHGNMMHMDGAAEA